MDKNVFLSYVLGLLTATLVSVALVFVFAVILSNVGVSPTLVRPINQAIKVAAVTIGGVIALKGDKGAIKGLIFGAVYALAVGLLFAAIAGKLSLDAFFLLDVLICAVAGAIIGVIKVNSAKN